MGRRINISQPTVIKTELPPLTDMFDILASDSLLQWYYVNDGSFKPNRQETPLTLTPVITAVDESTGDKYTPNPTSAAWYWLDVTNGPSTSSDELWPGKGYSRINETADGAGVDWYVPSESNTQCRLVVKKNVPVPTGTTSGITLCCSAKYTDPRDSGIAYIVRQTVILATNQDATMENLTVVMDSPSSQKFNVFTSDKLQTVNGEQKADYTLSAIVLDANNNDVTASHYVEWYGRLNGGAEVKLDTLMAYKKATQGTGEGQGKGTVKVNMMHAEKLDVIVKVRKTTSASSALISPTAFASIVWDIPKLDCYTACKNGSAVNNEVRDMTFETIVNIKGETLTDSQKSWNLQFQYKSRVSSSGTFTSRGWGQSKTLSSSDLRQTTSKSTTVHSEAYLQGPYEVVTYNDEDITYNGEEVYDRT